METINKVDRLEVKQGQYVARRSIMDYLKAREYTIKDVYGSGSIVYFEVVREGIKYLLKGLLGKLEVDHTLDQELASYRDRFEPVKSFLHSEVVKIESIARV